MTAEQDDAPPAPPHPSPSVADALAALREAAALAEAATAATGRALATVQGIVRTLAEGAVERLPPPDALPCPHRRAHRSGTPRKIDTDPELQAFIAARIDRMTFSAIADEIARHFPEHRRVRRSAINEWWQASRRPHRRTAPDESG
jgi:hypothetical protein